MGLITVRMSNFESGHSYLSDESMATMLHKHVAAELPGWRVSLFDSQDDGCHIEVEPDDRSAEIDIDEIATTVDEILETMWAEACELKPGYVWLHRCATCDRESDVSNEPDAADRDDWRCPKCHRAKPADGLIRVAIYAEHCVRAGERAWEIEEENRQTHDADWHEGTETELRETAIRLYRAAVESRHAGRDLYERRAARTLADAVGLSAADLEMHAWAAAHGSEHLKTSLARGYDSKRIYKLERGALEWPGWFLDMDDEVDERERSNPSPAALAVETEVEISLRGRGVENEVRVVWLPFGTRDMFPGETVVIRDYLGHDLYVQHDSFERAR
jgi:hypothetical protein